MKTAFVRAWAAPAAFLLLLGCAQPDIQADQNADMASSASVSSEAVADSASEDEVALGARLVELGMMECTNAQGSYDIQFLADSNSSGGPVRWARLGNRGGGSWKVEGGAVQLELYRTTGGVWDSEISNLDFRPDGVAFQSSISRENLCIIKSA